MHDVFISYSSKDKSTADAICAYLEQNMIRCWIAPRDILPGDQYASSIVDAIKITRILVLVFSQDSATSTQVARELERAVHYNVIIIPFRIEDIIPEHDMEFYLSTPHWLDAMTPPLENHIKKLTQTVKSILGGKQTKYEIAINIPGLQIYRTGDLLNFERYESALYYFEDRRYVLNYFYKGRIYKHFILCEDYEKTKIQSYINSTGIYCTTGEGSRDEKSGKWRVWFIILGSPVEGQGVFMNNLEE